MTHWKKKERMEATCSGDSSMLLVYFVLLAMFVMAYIGLRASLVPKERFYQLE